MLSFRRIGPLAVLVARLTFVNPVWPGFTETQNFLQCGPYLSASAYAGGGFVEEDVKAAGMQMLITAEALSSTWVDVPEAGLYSLSFAIQGSAVHSGRAGIFFGVIRRSMKRSSRHPSCLRRGHTCIRPMCWRAAVATLKVRNWSFPLDFSGFSRLPKCLSPAASSSWAQHWPR